MSRVTTAPPAVALDYTAKPVIPSHTVALLADVGVDPGYCAQRYEMAGEEKHRALLARYPLVIKGAVPLAARAVLYQSLEGTPWSPVERQRSGDTLAIHLTPIGELIQWHGLGAAAPWLPLCEALLRRQETWVPLGDDMGCVLVEARGVLRSATLKRTLPGHVVSIGLHAARLGGATGVAIDCPLLSLADAAGVAEHTRAHLHEDWHTPGALVPFEPAPTREKMKSTLGMGPLPPLPSGTGIPPRVLPLWQHIVGHRYGFDLLREGEGAPIMGEVLIKLAGGTATLVCRWLRVNTLDPDWAVLCEAAHLDPKRALPWNFHVARYIHLFQEEQPVFAATQTREDARQIRLALAAAAQRMEILCHFQGNYIY